MRMKHELRMEMVFGGFMMITMKSFWKSLESLDHEENKEKSKKVMRVQYICMMMIIHVIMCKWMRELSEKVNLTNTRLVASSASG